MARQRRTAHEAAGNECERPSPDGTRGRRAGASRLSFVAASLVAGLSVAAPAQAESQLRVSEDVLVEDESADPVSTTESGFRIASAGWPDPIEGSGSVAGWALDAIGSLVRYGLLFLCGLLLFGLSRQRFETVQVAVVRTPVKAGLYGLAGLVGAVLAMVVLAVTVIGIPLTVLIALSLPLMTAMGLSVVASVLGAALPVEGLRGKPVAQLAAGTALLFVASLIPLVGSLVVAVACLVGVGSLLLTHGGRETPPPPAPGHGPYRTAAA